MSENCWRCSCGTLNGNFRLKCRFCRRSKPSSSSPKPEATTPECCGADNAREVEREQAARCAIEEAWGHVLQLEDNAIGADIRDALEAVMRAIEVLVPGAATQASEGITPKPTEDAGETSFEGTV